MLLREAELSGTGVPGWYNWDLCVIHFLRPWIGRTGDTNRQSCVWNGGAYPRHQGGTPKVIWVHNVRTKTFLTDRLLKMFSALKFSSIGAYVHDCVMLLVERSQMISSTTWNTCATRTSMHNSCGWKPSEQKLRLASTSPSHFHLLIERLHQKMKTSDDGHF